MNRPTENHIETYIRFPEELEYEEILWIEEWITKDIGLKMLADWFVCFYKLADELPDSQRIRPSKLNKIHLVPMPDYTINKSRRFVLSAQTVTRQKEITPVHTFVSEEHRTLMRVLDNKKKQIIQFHILSDLAGSDDIVLLHFSDKNFYLASQPGGKVEISYSKLSKEEVETWASCTLLLPLLTANISKESSYRNGFIGAKSAAGIKTIKIAQARDEVIVSVENEQVEDNAETLVIKQGNKTQLLKMQDGKASIPRDKFEDRNSSMFFY